MDNDDTDYRSDRDRWAEDHGYRHIKCQHCGWSGMTDTDACDRGCDSREGDEDEDGEPAVYETLRRSTIQVARKAYPGINPGDTYRRTVVGGYTKGGPRWLKVYRTLVTREAPVTDDLPF